MWRFGILRKQLEAKSNKYGIELIKVNEAYTSQICPSCGNKHKSNSRNYVCKKCGYVQHRDVVGAINILNMNTEYKLQRYINKVYLQI